MSKSNRRNKIQENNNKIVEKEIAGSSIVLGAFGSGGAECLGVIEWVKNTGDGIFTKYVGCNYLYKGHANKLTVDAVGVPKKMISGFPLLMNNNSLKFMAVICCLIFLLFPKKSKDRALFALWKYFTEVGFKSLKPVALARDNYCTMARELYRAFDKCSKGLLYDDLEIPRIKTIEMICMIMEFDFAYRIRVQDVLPKLDKEALEENPAKELTRLVSIMNSRQVGSEMKNKFGWLGIVIKILLNTNKGFKKIFVNSLLELDLKKIDFDEADIYYILDRNDYDYLGEVREERMKRLEPMDQKVGNKRLKITIREKTKEDESLDKVAPSVIK